MNNVLLVSLVATDEMINKGERAVQAYVKFIQMKSIPEIGSSVNISPTKDMGTGERVTGVSYVPDLDVVNIYLGVVTTAEEETEVKEAGFEIINLDDHYQYILNKLKTLSN